MEVIKLNLIPGKACPVVHVSQFDDGREFKAELYEGVNVYTLDGTETLTAIVKKPDGNEVTAAVTNTSDNYVIITTTEQMTACAGGNLGTLRIEKGAVTIATLNFILECQASPDTGIQSDSEIHNLEAQVNQMVEDAVAEQYDSNNVLFDTAPTSGHGVPYAVTSGGLWSWLRDLPLRAYPTASGAIATFDTSLALPLQDCTIAINAVQESGTPTPSSPKLISGFTGANIVNISGNNSNLVSYIRNIYLGTYGFVDLGSLSWTYNSSLAYFYATLSDMKQAVQPNELLNWFQNKYTQIGARFNVDWGSAPDKSIGTRQTTSYLCVKDSAYTDTTAFTNAMSGVYLLYELDTPTTPSITSAQLSAICNSFGVSGNVTPISWQTEAGTVYGGSLKIANGYTHLIDGKNYVDLASLSWSDANGNLSSSSGIASDVKAPSANTEAFNGLCSCYVVAPRTGISDKQISVQTNGNIVISDTGIAGMTGAQIKTYLTGFVLAYERATPVEYTLTSTPPIYSIVGTNNVFTDTNGNTSVVYACSLKDYIEGQ